MWMELVVSVSPRAFRGCFFLACVVFFFSGVFCRCVGFFFLSLSLYSFLPPSPSPLLRHNPFWWRRSESFVSQRLMSVCVCVSGGCGTLDSRDAEGDPLLSMAGLKKEKGGGNASSVVWRRDPRRCCVFSVGVFLADDGAAVSLRRLRDARAV